MDGANLLQAFGLAETTMPFKDWKLEIVQSLLIKLMAELFDRPCAAVRAATVGHYTKNNISLKGVVCSIQIEIQLSWLCDSVSELQGRDGFAEQLFVWLCVSGKTTDTGGESVSPVIYRDLLGLALCCGLPPGLRLPSSPFSPASSRALITMIADFSEWKSQMSSRLRTRLLFPRMEPL